MMEELRLNDYIQYATLCECGMTIVQAMVEILRLESKISGERSPYDTIRSRIKSFDSIREKCARKGIPFTVEGMRELRDIAGIRIITLYQDDIYRIRKALVRQPSMELIEERDYVERPKENGYRSLHLIVSVHVYFLETTKSVPVEIQIRTKAMDLWACVEHDCNYKKDDASAEAQEMFAEAAENLNDFDRNATRIRDASLNPN